MPFLISVALPVALIPLIDFSSSDFTLTGHRAGEKGANV